jgi:predicted amidohydrolase
MASFQAGAVQMAATGDKERNRAVAARLVRAAAAAGARLVVLPEVFGWRGPRNEEALEAETIPGPTTEGLARLARELGIHLVAGSLLERGGPGGRVYNTSCLLSPAGDIVARYRKIHLFDVDLPGRVQVRESDTRAPGTEVVVADTPFCPIGLSVCYDLRFPELYRRLARGGAALVTVPSAFTAPTGRAHWETLMRARAIENQLFVVAANQFGPNAHGFEDWGDSMVVDPWGEILARVRDGEGIAVARIDLERLATVRREMPCLAHARLLS